MRRVIVVGSGIAGLASALTLHKGGVEVILVRGGAGASLLCAGALDGPSPSGEAESLLRDLALTSNASTACVATHAGVLRTCTIADRALLDLSRLEGGVIRIPRAIHPQWDADTLADGLNESATGTDLQFEAVDVPIMRYADERGLPDPALALRHDEEDRANWLAESLARGSKDACAFLLPPWLGVESDVATKLSQHVGIPCGEVVGYTPAPFGMRFERARERVLNQLGVECATGYMKKVQTYAREVSVLLEDGHELFGSEVVLACGGIVAGAIRYAPSETLYSGELPPSAGMSFQLSFDGNIPLGVRGQPLTVPGSLFGEAPEALAWPYVREPALLSVGALCTDQGSVSPRVWAVGDFAGDQPRKWLQALESGISTARAILSM